MTSILVGDTVRNLFNDGRLMLVPEPAVVAALNKFYRSEDFRVRPREHILDVCVSSVSFDTAF
jgi:hypothetical protein